jgi:hypothetical protein
MIDVTAHGFLRLLSASRSARRLGARVTQGYCFWRLDSRADGVCVHDDIGRILLESGSRLVDRTAKPRGSAPAQDAYAGERLTRVRKAREVFLIVELLVIADVEAARVAHRLKVPGRVAAFAQRRVNEVTPMLACKHRLVQLG